MPNCPNFLLQNHLAKAIFPNAILTGRQHPDSLLAMSNVAEPPASISLEVHPEKKGRHKIKSPLDDLDL